MNCPHIHGITHAPLLAPLSPTALYAPLCTPARPPKLPDRPSALGPQSFCAPPLLGCTTTPSLFHCPSALERESVVVKLLDQLLRGFAAQAATTSVCKSKLKSSPHMVRTAGSNHRLCSYECREALSKQAALRQTRADAGLAHKADRGQLSPPSTLTPSQPGSLWVPGRLLRCQSTRPP